MSKFVSNLNIVCEFEGDSVTFASRPMSRVVAVQLRPEVNGDGTARMSAASQSLILDAFGTHTDSVSGLRDAGGNAVSKEVVFEQAYFLPLIMEAAGKWAERSVPEAQPKN